MNFFKKKIVKKKEKLQKSVFSTLIRVVCRTFFIVGIWIGIIGIILLIWCGKDLPDLDYLQAHVRNPSVTIQTFDGTVLGSYGDLYEDVVKVEDLPVHVPKALMAVEDKRFYSHFGVDIVGFGRALYTNYIAKKIVQGGSTLTQQLAKNILLTEGQISLSDRSIKRKIQELILALWLESKFTKNQILTMYLNRVYFGSGTYGIDAASRKYFNKSARNLSVFEAALIAGLLKAPSKYSPSHHPKRSLQRAAVVLKLMEESGFLKNYRSYLKKGQKAINTLSNSTEKGARYFSDWVYEGLPHLIGPLEEDLIVITTLDPHMQKHAENVCLEYLETMGKEFNVSQAALLTMTPQGEIKAMVGGKSYTMSQFNRVTQATRQFGSAFKVFPYFAALEAGKTLDTIIDDTPFETGTWKPKNYFWKSRGGISLKDGFTYSVNSVSIRLTQEIGVSKVIECAHRLGITGPLEPNLTLALGTSETNLLEMTAAYAAFSNNGCSAWPYGVLEIRNKKGEIIYKHQKIPPESIMSKAVLDDMRTLLRDAVNRGYGRACNIDSTVSGKTGSNGDKDACFFAYREARLDEQDPGFSNIVIGVWVGNDNNKPMAKRSTGGRIPTRLAAAFLKGSKDLRPSKKALKKQSVSSHLLNDFLKKNTS